MVNVRRQKTHQQHRISRSAFSWFLYFFMINEVFFKVTNCSTCALLIMLLVLQMQSLHI